MPQATLSPDMTMEAILQVFPSAQRALFQRYHVGGCSSCAFQPGDTLAEVCRDHNLLDVNEVMDFIRLSDDADRRLQVDPKEVAAWLEKGEDFRFIDARKSEEIELAVLPPAEPLDFTDQGRYMNLPKDTRIVFSCKSGAESLNVAAYFAGHGFTAVYSLRGGIDAWRNDVDPSIPTY